MAVFPADFHRPRLWVRGFLPVCKRRFYDALIKQAKFAAELFVDDNPVAEVYNRLSFDLPDFIIYGVSLACKDDVYAVFKG
jgi:hypothetical protein